MPAKKRGRASNPHPLERRGKKKGRAPKKMTRSKIIEELRRQPKDVLIKATRRAARIDEEKRARRRRRREEAGIVGAEGEEGESESDPGTDTDVLTIGDKEEHTKEVIAEHLADQSTFKKLLRKGWSVAQIVAALYGTFAAGVGAYRGVKAASGGGIGDKILTAGAHVADPIWKMT